VGEDALSSGRGGGASEGGASPYSDWARDPTEPKSSGLGDEAREFLDEGGKEGGGSDEGANEGSIDPLPGVWMV